MISRTPIDTTRIRKITGSFSWIDHRLLSQGFVKAMTSDELLLYFFLVLVSDKNGVSFYGYDRICGLLKITVDQFISARNHLVEKSLIAIDNGRFQVLQLPEKGNSQLAVNSNHSTGELLSLAEIFQQWSKKLTD
jgi:hypothetical protein